LIKNASGYLQNDEKRANADVEDLKLIKEMLHRPSPLEKDKSLPDGRQG